MAFGYLLVAILAAAITIFALQNSAPTTVRFLLWAVDGVPVSAVILLSLTTGVAVAGLPLLIQRWRLRSRTRALESRVAALESTLAERTRGGAPPPAPRSSNVASE
jgi:uncharacterized integral membrane protein